jgi:LCP family protein required for cell wall assembly
MAGPEHSDAIMVLRIFPSIHRASLLSIPRDLNVPIAGTRGRDRINAAYAGGPERLVETIHDNFGIPIDHFIDADFVGFRSVVTVLGGLNVYFPTPTRDVMSGLYVPTAGCVHLDPNNTLAYVRSRHTQFYEKGRWRNDPLSDLSRVKRQQDFMRRLLGRIKMIRNPFVAKRVADASAHYFKMDDKFSFWDALRFVRALRGVAPETLQATTLPVDNINVGGAAELRLQQPEASAVVDSFLRGPAAARQTAPGAGQIAAPAHSTTSPTKC